MKLPLSPKIGRNWIHSLAFHRSGIRTANDPRAGLTLLEVIVILWVLIVLVAMVVPLLVHRHRGDPMLTCVNDLKHVGLAFRIWEDDHNGKYPMQVSTTNGGAMELVASGNPVPVFQVMSNELSTPKVVVCPEDRNRNYATNFTSSFNSNTVSYFVNPDAVEANPQAILGGDDNLQINGVRAKAGLLTITPDVPLSWSPERHKSAGYLLIADGSVQAASNPGLRNYLFPTNGSSTVRLALP